MEARHRLDLFLDAPGEGGVRRGTVQLLLQVFAGAVHPVVDRGLRDLEKSRHLCLSILAQLEESDRRALRLQL